MPGTRVVPTSTDPVASDVDSVAGKPVLVTPGVPVAVGTVAVAEVEVRAV